MVEDVVKDLEILRYSSQIVLCIDFDILDTMWGLET